MIVKKVAFCLPEHDRQTNGPSIFLILLDLRGNLQKQPSIFYSEITVKDIQTEKLSNVVAWLLKISIELYTSIL